jgi:hypothetical protein
MLQMQQRLHTHFDAGETPLRALLPRELCEKKS